MVRLNPVLLALGVLCALQVPEVSAGKELLDELLNKNIDFTGNEHIDEPLQIARDFKRTRDAYEVIFNKWNLTLKYEIEDILFKKFDELFARHFTDASRIESDRAFCNAKRRYELSNYVVSLEAKALKCGKDRIEKAAKIQEKLEDLNDQIEKMNHDISPCFYAPSSSSKSRSRRSPEKSKSFKKIFKEGIKDWGEDKLTGLATDALHKLKDLRFKEMMALWKQGCLSEDLKGKAKTLRREILDLIMQFKILRTENWSPESDCLKTAVFKGQDSDKLKELRQKCRSRQ